MVWNKVVSEDKNHSQCVLSTPVFFLFFSLYTQTSHLKDMHLARSLGPAELQGNAHRPSGVPPEPSAGVCTTEAGPPAQLCSWGLCSWERGAG